MSRRAFPNWGRARNVDRSQTNREYDNLAATSPEETISKLRSFHRGKNPERTNVAASIVQLFDSLAQRKEFAFKEIIHQYVMFGLHELLLDIAMNQKIYLVRSNHNLEKYVEAVLSGLSTCATYLNEEIEEERPEGDELEPETLDDKIHTEDPERPYLTLVRPWLKKLSLLFPHLLSKCSLAGDSVHLTDREMYLKKVYNLTITGWHLYYGCCNRPAPLEDSTAVARILLYIITRDGPESLWNQQESALRMLSLMNDPPIAPTLGNVLREASLSDVEYRCLAVTTCRFLQDLPCEDSEQMFIIRCLELLRTSIIVYPPIVSTKVGDSTILRSMIGTCQKELCLGTDLLPDAMVAYGVHVIAEIVKHSTADVKDDLYASDNVIKIIPILARMILPADFLRENIVKYQITLMETTSLLRFYSVTYRKDTLAIADGRSLPSQAEAILHATSKIWHSTLRTLKETRHQERGCYRILQLAQVSRFCNQRMDGFWQRIGLV